MREKGVGRDRSTTSTKTTRKRKKESTLDEDEISKRSSIGGSTTSSTTIFNHDEDSIDAMVQEEHLVPSVIVHNGSMLLEVGCGVKMNENKDTVNPVDLNIECQPRHCDLKSAAFAKDSKDSFVIATSKTKNNHTTGGEIPLSEIKFYIEQTLGKPGTCHEGQKEKRKYTENLYSAKDPELTLPTHLNDGTGNIVGKEVDVSVRMSRFSLPSRMDHNRQIDPMNSTLYPRSSSLPSQTNTDGISPALLQNIHHLDDMNQGIFSAGEEILSSQICSIPANVEISMKPSPEIDDHHPSFFPGNHDPQGGNSAPPRQKSCVKSNSLDMKISSLCNDLDAIIQTKNSTLSSSEQLHGQEGRSFTPMQSSQEESNRTSSFQFKPEDMNMPLVSDSWRSIQQASEFTQSMLFPNDGMHSSKIIDESGNKYQGEKSFLPSEPSRLSKDDVSIKSLGNSWYNDTSLGRINEKLHKNHGEIFLENEDNDTTKKSTKMERQGSITMNILKELLSNSLE